MRLVESIEEVAQMCEDGQRTVFLFSSDWCGDCRYLKPYLSEIEERLPNMRFIQLDRERFLPLAKEWDIFGIPSLVVIEKGQEVGRFVDKNRKTKAQIIEFLEGLV